MDRKRYWIFGVTAIVVMGFGAIYRMRRKTSPFRAEI